MRKISWRSLDIARWPVFAHRVQRFILPGRTLGTTKLGHIVNYLHAQKNNDHDAYANEYLSFLLSTAAYLGLLFAREPPPPGV